MTSRRAQPRARLPRYARLADSLAHCFRRFLSVSKNRQQEYDDGPTMTIICRFHIITRWRDGLAQFPAEKCHAGDEATT